MTDSVGQKWMREKSGYFLIQTLAAISPVAYGKKSNTLSHVSTFVLKKDFSLQALSESVITNMCVCLRGHLTWKKRLLRVIREEGSPKLEHAHNIFSLVFLLPLSNMKTSSQTLPKHPSVTSLHPHTLTLKDRHISMNDTGSGHTSEFTAKFIHL